MSRPATGDGAVSLLGVRARYAPDKPWVLDIERLEVGRGERVAFIGPSGSGKTTLLRLINGYIEPEAGRLVLFGEETDWRSARRREVRRRLGFVFQDFNLVDRATVFDNVLWGRLGRVSPLLSLFGVFPGPDRRAALDAIAEVDLQAQVGQRADTLSGGQKQRVGVARAVAQEPEIILADEPVSNLDPALADDILELLVDVSERHRATLLMSLHQPDLARRYAQRVVGLRGGRAVHDGDADALDEEALRRIYGRDHE